jgi:hypothetical protein
MRGVRVDHWIGYLSQSFVHHPTLLRRGRTIDSRTNQGMPEPDPVPHLEQTRCLRCHDRGDVNTKILHGTPQQRHITQWFRSGQQHQLLRPLREQFTLVQEPLLQAACQTAPLARCPDGPEVEFRRGQLAGQLQEGKRVPMGFGQYAVTNRFIEPAGDSRLEQPCCVTSVESAHQQLRKAGQDGVLRPRPNREDQRKTPSRKSTRDEPENLRGLLVQPLRVVNDTDGRLLLGHLRQQCQHSQANQKTVRRSAWLESECRAQRVALWRRQIVQSIQERDRIVDAEPRTAGSSPTRHRLLG